MEIKMKQNKYEIDMCNGSIMDKLISFSLPLMLSGKKYQEMERRLATIAEKLGITMLLEKYPYEVSGGQKQRAAIARALITKPQLILADEPSGALDSKAADSLMHLFHTINMDGQTIVMVTHSVKAASSASSRSICFFLRYAGGSSRIALRRLCFAGVSAVSSSK